MRKNNFACYLFFISKIKFANSQFPFAASPSRRRREISRFYETSSVNLSSVNTTRVHGPCPRAMDTARGHGCHLGQLCPTRPVNTGVIFDTRVHGPCPRVSKMAPCSRPVDTGSVRVPNFTVRIGMNSRTTCFYRVYGITYRWRISLLHPS